jgi:hypothetical protein
MSAFWRSWGPRRFELWLAAAVAIDLTAVVAARVNHPAVHWGLAFDVAITVPARAKEAPTVQAALGAPFAPSLLAGDEMRKARTILCLICPKCANPPHDPLKRRV